MMKTNKWLLGAFLSAASALAATPSWAVFGSISKATTTASVTFSQTGTVAFSIQPRNVSNNAAAGSISWTPPALPFTTNSGWLQANQYIELVSTITAGNGGIQIYTNNEAADAAVKHSTSAAGLAAGLVDNTDTTKTLPLAWAIRDATTTVVTGDPDVVFNWLFFKDPGSDAPNTLVNGETYATAKDGSGIHFGPADTEFGAAPSPDVIYLEANFASAVTPRTYSATIRVEAFTE